MKHSLFALIQCLLVLLFAAGTVSAVPLMQSADDSGSTNIADVFSLFRDLVSSGIEAADQAAGSDQTENQNLTETLPDLPTEAPTAAAVPTSVPAEIPMPTIELIPAQPKSADNDISSSVSVSGSGGYSSAPEDPESISVSTGIGISEFYNSFKSNVKDTGRHSVSFEERGGKNASKVQVDDEIEVLLHFDKNRGSDLVDHLTFKANYGDQNGKDNTAVILWCMFKTLDDYLHIGMDESMINDILDLAYTNGSAAISDLLVYGTAAGGGSAAAVTFKVYYTGVGYEEPETTSYSYSAEEDFRDLVSWLKDSGSIPVSSGAFRFHEDYQTEWAQINWYQWESFATAKNFVISTDISWASATDTPNFSNAGCGFVLRGIDASNHIFASMNMDGKIHIGGVKGGKNLNYGEFGYSSHSTKGTSQLTLVVNDDVISVYVNGSMLGQQRNLAFDQDGSLGFLIQSGSNKDYGTRCEFKNVYYYVW